MIKSFLLVHVRTCKSMVKAATPRKNLFWKHFQRFANISTHKINLLYGTYLRKIVTLFLRIFSFTFRTQTMHHIPMLFTNEAMSCLYTETIYTLWNQA